MITAAEFHPHHCNTFVYSSSKGTIRLCDMRTSALCDRHAKCEYSPRQWDVRDGVPFGLKEPKKGSVETDLGSGLPCHLVPSSLWVCRAVVLPAPGRSRGHLPSVLPVPKRSSFPCVLAPHPLGECVKNPTVMFWQQRVRGATGSAHSDYGAVNARRRSAVFLQAVCPNSLMSCCQLWLMLQGSGCAEKPPQNLE